MTDLAKTWRAGSTVWSLAVSPDDAYLAAGVGSTLMVWDLHTEKAVLGPIKGHGDSVYCVAFSPDGQTLASGSYDKTVRTWDGVTGHALLILTGHTMAINSVAFSHDGLLLISGSNDKTIRLWHARTGEPAGVPIQTNHQVLAVTMSRSGNAIISALSDATLTAYDPTTAVILFECEGHTDSPTSLAISQDDRRIVSGSWDSSIRSWNAATGDPIGEPLIGHTDLVQSIAFSPDGKYIASGSQDWTIRIWDAETGMARTSPLSEHAEGVLAVAFTRDGTRLVSGSRDCTVRIWDMRSLVIQVDSSEEKLSNETPQIEDEITSTMTIDQIISLLGTRGCADLTDQLDLATSSNVPVSAGGFGDIYRCNLKDGTDVAIKTMRLYAASNDQNRKQLKYTARELYAWSKCLHVNVQPLLGVVNFRGRIGMIATWELNGNLPDYLDRHPEADRCTLSAQIAEGLSYLHTSRVIHGDLKGANVMISRYGVPQLADFGNAVLQEYTLKFTETSTKEALSARWAVKTPGTHSEAWLIYDQKAPELFEGGKPSTAADVYALGMTILETVTGNIPWAEMSERSIMFTVAIKKAHPARPEEYIPTASEHGEALWFLLKSCWDHEPGNRPNASHVRTKMLEITQVGLTRG